MRVAWRRLFRHVQVDITLTVTLHHVVYAAKIGARLARGCVFLKTSRENAVVGMKQSRTLGRAEGSEQFFMQPIGPGNYEVSNLVLNVLDTDGRAIAHCGAHDNVDAG
jgi:hypothetical protein